MLSVMKSKMRMAFAGSVAAGLVMSFIAGRAAAAETRGYVVSWFYYATASEDSDCPHGTNDPIENFRSFLVERHLPPDKVAEALAGYPKSAREVGYGDRAVIDGKPANAILNPEAAEDPQLFLNEGKKSPGFDLDGKTGPKDFTDPETGTTGVDNMFYRATGCVIQMRAAAGKRPALPEMQWETVRDHQAAWLVEITTSGDWQNADDATVRIVQATQPIMRNVQGQPQADMTFTTDASARTAGNLVHGKIKNGVLTTGTFNFFMPGEPWTQTEYAFRDARMRWTFNPDGSARGVIGGYQDWRTFYGSLAIATQLEVLAGLNYPGIYYALRKSADAYPDPKTGQNTAISSAYVFDVIPAFVQDAQAAPAK